MTQPKNIKQFNKREIEFLENFWDEEMDDFVIMMENMLDHGDT